MSKHLKYLIIALLALTACQEEVFLDLSRVDPITVIEATWTDNASMNQVRIIQSRDYYDTTAFTKIEDAKVSIFNEETGQEIEFAFFEPRKVYLPLNNQTAKIGERYRLVVETQEDVFEGSGTVLEPPTLDSITYEFKEERIFREEGYYVKVYGKIPFTEDNFYRVRVIKNDTLLNRRSDYLLFDDSFGTSILDNGFELSGFVFGQNDRVRLELFRLNREMFNYYNQLVSLIFNDGGLFSPPPQNPESNIKSVQNGSPVLGFFLTTPFVTASVTIDEQDE
ncbi:DUF4249 domain-containing protein [Pararhodonellum marinum]|uniref:DUF4249 domain-containing protein n=1 Tax=Pararhodonellum marinum TaxID=2755358 RepID=UPI001890366D|nr:DUF4249 domain-containing protein [Pararhodonellum marinum]